MRWVDEFAAMMASKAQDWHMMQRVYVEDLDPERLARARPEHGGRIDEDRNRLNPYSWDVPGAWASTFVTLP